MIYIRHDSNGKDLTRCTCIKLTCITGLNTTVSDSLMHEPLRVVVPPTVHYNQLSFTLLYITAMLSFILLLNFSPALQENNHNKTCLYICVDLHSAKYCVVIPAAIHIIMYMYIHYVYYMCICMVVQIAEEDEEGCMSEPESPGIDPLVFSREDFDTGNLTFSVSLSHIIVFNCLFQFYANYVGK